jgi:hypothetical protein
LVGGDRPRPSGYREDEARGGDEGIVSSVSASASSAAWGEIIESVENIRAWVGILGCAIAACVSERRGRNDL